MLRPSISVWGLTDTALQTTEAEEEETVPNRLLFFELRDGVRPSVRHLGVAGEFKKKTSDLAPELQRGDIRELIIEAEAEAEAIGRKDLFGLSFSIVFSPYQRSRNVRLNLKARAPSHRVISFLRFYFIVCTVYVWFCQFASISTNYCRSFYLGKLIFFQWNKIILNHLCVFSVNHFHREEG